MECCSPLLFDIFIDDLLDGLDEFCYAVLAFADDIAIECEDLDRLKAAIGFINRWSAMNHIEVNFDKSGIIVVRDDGKTPRTIMNYPVVQTYKYLGIVLDGKMSPHRHLSKLGEKLAEYLKKNYMLHKKYFSPYTLVRLTEYFVRSRLAYGMCCFMDQNSVMTEIQKILMRHLKSIFGLPLNTGHNRLQLVLGIPDLRYRLAVLLLKNWHKYKSHYGAYPEKFRKTLLGYFSVDVMEDENYFCYTELKNGLVKQNLRELADDKLAVKIRSNHSEFLKQYVYTYHTLADYYLLSYFTHTCRASNKRLFEVCACGKPNTEGHAASDCEVILGPDKRKQYTDKIERIYLRNRSLELKKNLHEYLLDIYYSIELSWFPDKKGKDGKIKKDSRDLKDLVKLMKEITVWIVRKYPKDTKIDTYVSDDEEDS
jgi:hypothetical protein